MELGTWKSKSFWGGLAMIVTGIGMIIAGDTATGIQTITGGIVAVCLRDAISKTGGKG